MEIMVKGYWYSIGESDETDISGEDVENEGQSPYGDDPVETSDPDFEKVSEMLRDVKNATPSPSPSSSTETVNNEIVDYIPYLENISIQLGVIDIVLVLALLIYIIRQFVRVPR